MNIKTAVDIKQPHFMLVPSLGCTAECKYCFGPHKGPIMSEETADTAVNFMLRITASTGQRKLKVTFHGGEPLMAGAAITRRILDGLAERRGPAGLEAAIQSNLWMLDDELCSLFRQHHVEIGTSLDGPKDITDLQRGKGYFSRTMNGIDKARSHGLQVGCIATFTTESLPRWRETFDFFIQERINFSIHAAVPPLDGRHSPFALSAGQYGSLLKEMLDCYIDHRRDLTVSSLDQMAKGFVSGEGRICTFRDCLGMFIAIDPDGNLYPCQRFCGKPEYRLGTLAESPGIEELFSSPVAKRFASHQDAVRKDCDGCTHIEYCRGGCPYNTWADTNKDRIKDPYCEAYREVFDHIRKRLAEEMSTEENINAVAERPYNGKGHPLLKKGPLIELVRQGPHPSQIARNARRILAAVELAKGPDIPAVAERLVQIGVCRSMESAKASLDGLWQQLHPEKVRLNNLYLHLTFACQQHCTHCYAKSLQPETYVGVQPSGCLNDGGLSSTQPPPSSGNLSSVSSTSSLSSQSSDLSMPIIALEKLIREAKEAGFRQVIITGGEPLFRSDRDELLNMLAKLRPWARPMNLVLRTNFALPFSDEELLLMSKAFDQVVASIDGDEQSHDARRGYGTYAATVRNLESYAKICKEQSASRRSNGGLSQAQPFSRLGMALPSRNNEILTPKIDNGLSPDRLPPAELSIACVMRAAEIQGDAGQAVNALGKRLGIRRVRFRPLLPLGRAAEWDEPPTSEALGAHAEPMELIENGFHPVAFCGLGQNLYVEPSGQSFPCYAYHHPHSFLGNVIEKGLSEVLNSEGFQSLSRHSVDSNPKCRNCEVRYLCGGACRAWGGEACQHDLDAPPPECEGLKRRATALYRNACQFLGIENQDKGSIYA